jgi:hypothetical protein
MCDSGLLLIRCVALHNPPRPCDPSHRHGSLLLWLISHPNKVGDAELAHYDHVLGASTTYASRLEPLLGGQVSALLQCTDKNLFHPDPGAKVGYEALFVGNSRNAFRPAHYEAPGAGIDGTRCGNSCPPMRLGAKTFKTAPRCASF